MKATRMAFSGDFAKRKMETAWGMLIGDSIAMPVHWYYKPHLIKRDYNGYIKKFEAPHDIHPTCILTNSDPDGAGRSDGKSKVSKPVIGGIILHDKLQYWTGKSTHYHRGMKAGENTLNSVVCLKVTFQTMHDIDADVSMDPREFRGKWLEKYVAFMTTPDTHNDTYAESFHRMFFRDWSQLPTPPTDAQGLLNFCEQRYSKVTPANEDHQIPVIGAFSMAVPWIVHYSGKSEDECAKNTVEAIKLTHPAPTLEAYVDLYARLLYRVINGADLKTEALKMSKNPLFGRKGKVIEKFCAESSEHEPGSDEAYMFYQEAVAILGMACYIDGSMPSMLFLASCCHDNFRAGVLSNANAGGENAHRGAALGALLGANSVSHGTAIPQGWKDQLAQKVTFSV